MYQRRIITHPPPRRTGQGEPAKVAPRRLGPLNVLHGLQGLWASRVISQDAFFLGAQICQSMLDARASTLEYAGETAQGRYTVLSGVIYTGPLVKNLSLYITALQDLHFRGGLLNDLVMPDTADPTLRTTHFTLSPNWIAGMDYDMATPICYRIVPAGKDEFFTYVNTLSGAALGDTDALEINK